MAQVSSSQAGQARSYWVPAVLFVFALLLLVGPFPFRSPVPQASPVDARFTDRTPVRRPLLAPSYAVGVFTYRCNDCHAIIPPPRMPGVRTVLQHKEIQLEHGINTECLNCHHPANRNAFVDYGGGEIPWDQPQRLCAKCHGPVYRDWQHGSHGRTNGYWDKSRGEQTRRKCIECHDPHRPPFPSLAPAPGPNTLRMGIREGGHDGGASNPLRVRGRAGSNEFSRASNEGH